MKIYVASSWRNEYYPEVVNMLRENGFDVYDFRNPSSGDEGGHWHNVSERWLGWNPEEYCDNLKHPLAERQLRNDILLTGLEIDYMFYSHDCYRQINKLLTISMMLIASLFLKFYLNLPVPLHEEHFPVPRHLPHLPAFSIQQ